MRTAASAGALLSLLGLVCAAARHACKPPMAQRLSRLTALQDGSAAADGVWYPEGLFWREGGQAWGCPCELRPCLWLCCPARHVFNLSEAGDRGCVPGDDSFATRARVPLLDAGEKRATHGVLRERFHLRYEELCPKRKVFLEPGDALDEYVIATDGRLMLPNAPDADYVDVGRFCVTYLLDEEGSGGGDLAVMQCLPGNELPPVKEAVYPALIATSALFLLVTFVVYLALPELRNFPGLVLMSHVFALFHAYFFNVVVRLVQGMSKAFCIGSAFIIYFAFLASFFWLNVMCLDIWWTFSGFRPMRGSVKEREHKKFIIYSLYCWGSPLIMLIICMIMDLHPGIPDNYEKPGFGELKCWFRSNMANFIYFSGPIAILIVCNIILFILTAVKIRQVKRGTKILKKQDSRRHNEEEENNAQRFNLYLKLFLVMGVNWIMEIVSFAAGGPDEYWYITDIANTLQGVLIFIIFVWKDRIRKLLVERFCPSRAVNSNSLANSSSTRTTAIRHNGSVMSSGRPSFRNNKDDYQMKTLTTVRSDDSDIA